MTFPSDAAVSDRASAVPTGAALAPLRACYADWLGLDAAAVVDARQERPDEIRALQLLLRLERPIGGRSAPGWHRALASAATLCAALCLDPRSEPGGEWYDAVADYCAGHIRKVTRRGHGAQWEATAALPGVTSSVDGTEVRALLPGLMAALDKRVAKLQVGGTELPVDDPEPIAAALLAGDDPAALLAWTAAGCPVRVERRASADWTDLLARIGDPEKAWQDEGLLAVRDAGFTEIAPGTVTVIARAPRP